MDGGPGPCPFGSCSCVPQGGEPQLLGVRIFPHMRPGGQAAGTGLWGLRVRLSASWGLVGLDGTPFVGPTGHFLMVTGLFLLYQAKPCLPQGASPCCEGALGQPLTPASPYCSPWAPAAHLASCTYHKPDPRPSQASGSPAVRPQRPVFTWRLVLGSVSLPVLVPTVSLPGQVAPCPPSCMVTPRVVTPVGLLAPAFPLLLPAGPAWSPQCPLPHTWMGPSGSGGGPHLPPPEGSALSAPLSSMCSLASKAASLPLSQAASP